LTVPVQWEQYDVSGETTGGEELFQEAMQSLKRNKVGLKGESRLATASCAGYETWL
jgi:isocitrate dehydrogenase (NAD+)